MTGPAAEIIMMGYAKTSQSTHGIHTRLFSRAFIFEEDEGLSDGGTNRTQAMSNRYIVLARGTSVL